MMSLLWLYKKLMTLGVPAIRLVLARRVKEGKEDASRLGERMGVPSHPRPAGSVIWVHVASVGEAQSMLPLIDLILRQFPAASVLVTSITVTSASLLQSRLPERAFHQYLPVDNPAWVRAFLDHWQPNLALWAESELWPNMLHTVWKRRLPLALINARMSPKSHRNWIYARKSIQELLAAFTVILCQTMDDASRYLNLGARSVAVTGNIKFSADPLPCDEADLRALREKTAGRPIWLYASTHDGEESLACALHKSLAQEIPNLLTIIAPRHPARGDAIFALCAQEGLRTCRRGETKNLPAPNDQIYLADTMGELGLLYRIAPVSCIGRSFSLDGGGGHNPLEAALLGSAVLHGPHVQNLQQIFDDMDRDGAALCLKNPEEMVLTLRRVLTSPDELKSRAEKAYAFAQERRQVLAHIVEELEPLFLQAQLPVLKMEGSA